MASIGCLAQKSYVTIRASLSTLSCNFRDGNILYSNIYLTGDIPTDMSAEYQHNLYYNNDNPIGKILNILSARGYEVETMTVIGESSVVFLLSKKTNDSSSAKIAICSDINEEVTEIARYNLQGIPVKESEKGIQIIVYSNYTTKTIVVE